MIGTKTFPAFLFTAFGIWRNQGMKPAQYEFFGKKKKKVLSFHQSDKKCGCFLKKFPMLRVAFFFFFFSFFFAKTMPNKDMLHSKSVWVV